MISEAVCAGLPVVGVAPRRHSFDDEERGYRDFMRDNGWSRSLLLAELTPRALLRRSWHRDQAASGEPSRPAGSDVCANACRSSSPRGRPQRPCRVTDALSHAGGGPNTSTAFKPPNANEFDMA